ncbi:hypothetical protein ACFL1X_10500 [Candidatus Hydrogenedentota bacterium]
MGVERIGGVPDPLRREAAVKRERDRVRDAREAPSDEVALSPVGKQASQVSRYVDDVKDIPDIRDVEVALAREHLDEGALYDEDVLRETARKLLAEEEGL